MNLSKFFIDRPIFAGVLSLLIFLGGLIAVRALPISEYPEVVPPSVVVRAQYPGANPKVIAETVATPLEEAINGVEGMLYMSSQATTDGLMTLTVTFKPRHRSRQGAAAGAEPRRAGRAAPARRSAPARHHDREELARPDDGRAPGVAQRPLRHELPAQLRGAERQGPAGAHRRASAQVRPGAAATTRCASGSIRRRSRSAGCRASDVVAAIRGQNVQAAAGVVGASPALPGIDVQLSINAQGRLQNEEEFGDIIVKTGADGAVTRLRDIAPARARRGRLFAALAARTTTRPSASACSRRRARTRCRSPPPCARRWKSSRSTCPRASSTASPTTRRSSCAPRSSRWSRRCSKRSRWWCWW